MRRSDTVVGVAYYRIDYAILLLEERVFGNCSWSSDTVVGVNCGKKQYSRGVAYSKSDTAGRHGLLRNRFRRASITESILQVKVK